MKSFLYERRSVFRSEIFSGKKDSTRGLLRTRNGPTGVIKYEDRADSRATTGL